MDREASITAENAMLEDTLFVARTDPNRPDALGPRSPVMAWNEWDPLEEVIVGSLDGATIPTHHLTVIFNLPRAAQPFYRLASGWKYPNFMKKLAQAELDNFIAMASRFAGRTASTSRASSGRPAGPRAASASPVHAIRISSSGMRLSKAPCAGARAISRATLTARSSRNTSWPARAGPRRHDLS